ncbi:MAG: exodeoxyribonuclease V subunit gamma [Desulfobulbaceae bacterium]|nr:MAG: exodeoxyribonuclease V subunit gamma [Desulfobulbaceae bacterium]
MLVFHASNRTESLTEKLAEIISTSPLPSLFQPETFLIQSRGMERMLTNVLTEKFGVWGNSDFLLPLDFITGLFDKIGIEPVDEYYTGNGLVWAIEKLLREIDEPQFYQLRTYLTGTLTDRKRYQLAKQIADLFDQYQIMRPDLLDLWQKGSLAYNDDTERWQRALWLKISEQARSSYHRGSQITQLITKLSSNQGSALGDFPARLFIFGLHTLPPLFLEALNALANHCQIHFFILSPFQGYWGDMDSDKVLVKRKRAERELSGVPSSDIDQPFHPLLVKLGRQGAHFQELLLNSVEQFHEGWVYYHQPIDSKQPRLLNVLQAEILRDVDQPERIPKLSATGDETIKIVSCHSRYRELMVLKDYVLSWLYEDNTLELHEIGIMAPDISDYTPFIPALFDDIPYSLADKGVREENSYFETFLRFLALQDGRFEYSEVMSLLERPEVQQGFAFNSRDLDNLRVWLTKAGVRWGLSPEQRAFCGGYDGLLGTWREGLERLMMGVAIDRDYPVDGILPYGAVEGSSRTTLGGLARFFRVLETVEATCRKSHTLKTWSLFLGQWCDELFGSEENSELSELYRHFQSLGESARYNEKPFDFAIIREWFQEQGQVRSSTGFLSGKLMFCSMLPMRTIPFKIICLLGMNAGEFPRVTSNPSFDLLSREYRPGDRSVREDHRYQFLEAIISARHRLYLSYIGQSIQSGKPIPPSVLVSELIDSINEHHGVDLRIEAHPLHSSSIRYFSENSQLFSFNETQYEIARAYEAKGSGWQGIWQNESIPQSIIHEVDLATFIRFFRNPQRYLVESLLGITLHAHPASSEDSEPFELDGLQSYLVGNEIFERFSNKEPEQLILNRLQTKQEWPLGSPGKIQFTDQLENVKGFYQRIVDSQMGDPLPSIPVDLEIGGLRLVGELSGIHEHGQLSFKYAGIRGRDYLETWIQKLLLSTIEHPLKRVLLVGRRETIDYATIDEPLTHLTALVKLFKAGQFDPLKLFVEPGFAYTEQLKKNEAKGRTDPLVAAYRSYQQQVDKQFAPELDILFADRPPEELLGEEFLKVTTEVLLPVQNHLIKTTGSDDE